MTVGNWSGDWILCERTQRWAAALRLASERRPNNVGPKRLHETRSLADMLTQLAARPRSLVLIETHEGNLASVLECLATTTPKYPAARFAALLDNDLALRGEAEPLGVTPGRSEVRAALAEAGATAIARSPRQLDEIFAIAEMHARHVARRAAPAADQPLEAWAWSLLPWQDA